MKSILFVLFISTFSFASINNINSFEADFKQIITDEKDKKLTYSGHILASKPQNALWNYTKPVKKKIYIQGHIVTIVEPEIEQVIQRELSSDFNFFKIIKRAKQIDKNKYLAVDKNIKFTIFIKDETIKSISYIDEFENNVKIVFKNQKQNKKIDSKIFYPIIPPEYDIITD